MKKVFEDLYEWYFDVENHWNQLYHVVIMTVCIVVVKVGLLNSEKIINDNLFQAYVWAFIIILLLILALDRLNRVSGYMQLSSMIIMFGIFVDANPLKKLGIFILGFSLGLHLTIMIFRYIKQKQEQNEKETNK